MSHVGRRTIYLYGTSVLCVLMLIIGFLGIGKNNKSVKWGVGSMLLVFAFTYDMTVGPVCYSLVSELSSTRLRGKTLVLARDSYNGQSTLPQFCVASDVFCSCINHCECSWYEVSRYVRIQLPNS